MVELSYGVSTDVGHVRDHNEDCYLADSSLGLWLVADGMGGHACGDVASDIVVRAIGEAVGNGDELTDAIQKAHKAILESAEKGIGKLGMGSTVVAIHVRGNHYKLAWVGDSRAYLWNGKLRQISKDHSLVQMLVDTGNITEREAMNHPQKNIIYQNLGAPDIDVVNIGVVEGEFYRNQKILLCSDGLSDEISKDEISDTLHSGDNDQKITDNLISKVLEVAAEDNVTVVVVAAPDDAPEYTGDEK
jgi:protein phosphatase